MAEMGFVKAQSDNFPNIDTFMVMEFMKNNDLVRKKFVELKYNCKYLLYVNYIKYKLY